MPRTIYSIRLASQQDLDAVAALEHNWVLDEPVVGFEINGIEGLSNYVAQNEKSIWIAMSPDKVIGYVTASIHRSSQLAVVPSGQPYIEIDDLYVSPEHRSASLGSKMVETVLEFAREQEIKYASVFSASSKIADIARFYGKQGFEPWGIQFYRHI